MSSPPDNEREEPLPDGQPPVAAALDSILRLLRVGLVVLALLYLGSGITFVGAGDNALILRLGKVLPRVESPGLLLAWPRPFDRVVLVPGKRVVELELDEWKPAEVETEAPVPATFDTPTEAAAALFPAVLTPQALHPVRDGYSLTGDRNILRGSFIVRYRVVDPKAYALRLADPDAAIRQIAYRAVTRSLADESVDGALVERRQELASRTRAAAQSLADSAGLGIAVEAFEIRELTPPATVLTAFQEVIDAQISAQTMVNEALDEKAQQLPSAEARAFRVRAEAEATAQSVIVRAGAEAKSFGEILAAAEEDLTGYQLRRLSETRRAIWPGLKTITVLPQGENSVQLLLPKAASPPSSLPTSESFEALPTPVDMDEMEAMNVEENFEE
ncbi:MAG: protease modulator HflK, partial [Planctomycetota bacterium]